MPRFVVLEHDWPTPHFDLMLEAGDRLRSWRLEEPPRPGEVRAAAAPDHRLAYLEYEGPVSHGRGTVRRWDRGEFDWLVDDGASIEIDCRGERLVGRLRLRSIGG